MGISYGLQCGLSITLDDPSDFNSVLTTEDRIGGYPVVVFINNVWLSTLRSSVVKYLPERINDHCPIKVTLTNADS
ncbi:hypothetical protein H5410_045129 [Solanum commersonii]|uniref:Uncharacterized protein n=1 Tax=Solanum commersonii TaxID=4109 RepID=A0A9J5XAM9_SOLCO|nr:hypothetical protein H5410_045129 [Solanum commersonii]